MAEKHSPYPYSPYPSSGNIDVETALNKMQHLSLKSEENVSRDAPESCSRRLLNTPGVGVGARGSDSRSNYRGVIDSNAEVLYYLHHLQAKMQRDGNGYPPGNAYSNPSPYTWEDLEYLNHGGGRVNPQQQHPDLLTRDYSPYPQESPYFRPSVIDIHSPQSQASRQSINPHSIGSFDQHLSYSLLFERPQSHAESSYIGRHHSLPSRSPPPELERLRHRLSLDERMLTSHSPYGTRERGMLDIPPEDTWQPSSRRWTGVPRSWSPSRTPHADLYDGLATTDGYETHLPPGKLRGPSASQSPRSIVEAHFRDSRSELWGSDSSQMLPPGKSFPSGCGLQSRKLPPLHIPSHAEEEWSTGYLNRVGSHIDRLFDEYPPSSPGHKSLPGGRDSEADGTLSPTGSSSNPASQSQGIHSLYKTELCRSWEETGNCRYGGKCQFAHGHGDLRPVARHPKYKTEVCRTFNTNGTCPYGTRCRFIHRSPTCPANSLQTKSTEKILAPLDFEPVLDADADDASRSRLRIFRDICPADPQKASAMAA